MPKTKEEFRVRVFVDERSIKRRRPRTKAPLPTKRAAADFCKGAVPATPAQLEPSEPQIDDWGRACIKAMMTGDTRALTALLNFNSEQPLSREQRMSTALVLQTCTLERPKFRPKTPAYRLSDIEARIDKAMREVQADPEPRSLTVPKYAELNKMTAETLVSALANKRGSTRRAQQRMTRRPKVSR